MIDADSKFLAHFMDNYDRRISDPATPADIRVNLQQMRTHVHSLTSAEPVKCAQFIRNWINQNHQPTS